MSEYRTDPYYGKDDYGALCQACGVFDLNSPADDNEWICDECREVRKERGPVLPFQADKQDDGKLQIHLLPTEALRDIVRVYEFGSKKYSPNNWRKGLSYTRALDSCQRHLWEYGEGCDLDDESGLPHLAHAAFWMLSILTWRQTKAGTDDRYDGRETPQAGVRGGPF